MIAHGSMPRVLMVCQSFDEGLAGAGGAERQLQILSAELVRRGCPVHILAEDNGRGLPASESFMGGRLVRIRARGKLGYALGLVRFMLKHRDEYDVVHVHDPDMEALVCALMGKVLRTPVIVKHRGAHDMARFGNLRLSLLAHSVTSWIALDSASFEKMIGLGIPRARIFKVPNGVVLPSLVAHEDEKRKIRQSLGLPEDGVLAVWTGRFIPRKRVHTLLSAWTDLRLNGVVPKRLVLLGDGPLLKECLDLAQQSPSGRNILFRGRVRPERVTSYLKAADIFVLPSADEGMSNSLLEAMAHGLAIVCTPVGAAPEVLHGEREALFFPPDDQGALQRALRRVFDDTSLRTSLGSQARARAEEAYAIDVISHSYIDLYSEVISERGIHLSAVATR